jgi:hypothetical protein
MKAVPEIGNNIVADNFRKKKESNSSLGIISERAKESNSSQKEVMKIFIMKLKSEGK